MYISRVRYIGAIQVMKKILIIDDDHGVMTSLSVLLSEAGYHTCGVLSGKAAIEKITSEDFDLVLLDIVMPGENGLNTLTEIRRRSPSTRVIMITAFPTVEDAIETIRRGACDYIAKPFKQEELFSKIGRAIEMAGFEKDLKKINLDYILTALASPIRRGILKSIPANAKMRLTEIAKELKINDHSKVNFHLKFLKDCGLLEQDKEKSYVLTPEGEKVLTCLKIIENYLT